MCGLCGSKGTFEVELGVVHVGVGLMLIILCKEDPSSSKKKSVYIIGDHIEFIVFAGWEYREKGLSEPFRFRVDSLELCTYLFPELSDKIEQLTPDPARSSYPLVFSSWTSGRKNLNIRNPPK